MSLVSKADDPRTVAVTISTQIPGAAAKVPYLVDGQYVVADLGERFIADDSARIPVPGYNPELLGRSGADYIVTNSAVGSAPGAVLRITRGGAASVLASNVSTSDKVALSADGRTIVIAKDIPYGSGKNYDVTVKVIDSHSGDVIKRRTVRGYVTVLRADRRKVLLGRVLPNGRKPATLSWSLRSGSITTLLERRGYRVDTRQRLLASSDSNDCTYVSRLSAPRKTLWRSCRQAVDSFSPDGRMITVNNDLDDSPDRVNLRNARGRSIVKYDFEPQEFADYLFSNPGGSGSSLTNWETKNTMLLGVRSIATKYGTFGLSRCTTTQCEPAGQTWDLTSKAP